MNLCCEPPFERPMLCSPLDFLAPAASGWTLMLVLSIQIISVRISIIEITIPIERNTIIVSHFLEYVKDGIHYITGTETVLCPDCGQIMNPHCRCGRYIRRLNGMRDKLSVRVLFCALCHRYHRELPDFVTPFKHLCTEAIAAIHDAIGDYCVDDHSAARIRRWVERFLKFGSAILTENDNVEKISRHDLTIEILDILNRHELHFTDGCICSSCPIQQYPF